MAELIQPELSSARPDRTDPRRAPRRAGSRTVVFLHAVAFVVGFGAVFTLIGSAAGLLGQSLNQYLPVLQRLGAILLVLFGLITLGVFRWLATQISQKTDLRANPAAEALVSVLDFFNALLYTEKRVTEMHRVNRNWGFAGSLLLGVTFAAGWVPCIGPILASILFVASDTATAGQGATLLAIYSLGLGIPFLATGAAFSRATPILRRLNRYTSVVSILSGLFLFAVAYLLWTGSLATLTTRFDVVNRLIFSMNAWVVAGEDWVNAFSGPVGDITRLSLAGAAPLAFLAGVISFVSPCVLPLVPAYIGYLSGAAVGGGKE
ncbi:MAG: cytochrome c biogenesis protein CcdA [Caldilineaceae bacterium]|nr:cytochrome c biogenesis protein CcdA [Caldilineaceae bacterium]